MGVITNWGTAIITSLAATLALVFAFIPRLLGFIVILLIGLAVAKGLEKALVAILRKAGFERIANRIGLSSLERRMGMRMDASALLGKVVFWFVFLIFLVPAVDALGLTTVSNLLGTIIDYLPNVFVAILVLFLGSLLARLVGDVARGASVGGGARSSNIIGNIAHYTVLGFVALIALYQLQIAPAMVQTLFTAVIGAAAIAFAIAFGLGGREAAQRLLSRGERSLGMASSTDTMRTGDVDQYIDKTTQRTQSYGGQPAQTMSVPTRPAQTYEQQSQTPPRSTDPRTRQ